MQLLDGKTTSQKLLASLKQELGYDNSHPNLDIILVGDDQASLKYCQLKQQVAESIGIGGTLHQFPSSVSIDDLISTIDDLNSNPDVTGFFIQLPLPPHFNTNLILNSIDPKKDVDGLTAANLGRLFQNDQTAIVSATPLGIIKLLAEYNIDLDGKNAVIIGRSPYIGLPLVALLEHRHATVTLCHSHTNNLAEICSRADILISAISRSKFITPKFIKNGSVVVDIGSNYDQKGKLTGDVDFDNVKTKVSFITPVPGGVGPMTIASLLFNLVTIWRNIK
jgi:methylenetetrahydrofolate dehydrogenase (NADP+)/methenyltetrahydrofolate cyclohydrolase